MGTHIANCTKYNQVASQNTVPVYTPPKEGIQSAEGVRMC